VSEQARIRGKEGGGEAAQLRPQHMADTHDPDLKGHNPPHRKVPPHLHERLYQVFEKTLAGYSSFLFLFIAPHS